MTRAYERRCNGKKQMYRERQGGRDAACGCIRSVIVNVSYDLLSVHKIKDTHGMPFASEYEGQVSFVLPCTLNLTSAVVLIATSR